MKKQIQIGKLSFETKKSALEYFKHILNSYDFGETLNKNHFDDVNELLKTHKNVDEKVGVGIQEIQVNKITYKTKCFQIIRIDLSSEYFSYINCINRDRTSITKFSKVCRLIIKDDIREVKLSYFRANSIKGKVKCQETGDLLLWNELSIDHRQPNTFSIIVDRFIEINKIDLAVIEYINNHDFGLSFKDELITESFRKYHKEKANLRIVKKEKNLSRTFQGRLQRQKKDLKIE
jgi:hypothetical protein